ncbi:hypothetical protein M0813_29254 [Anaeramoeba flamelloides]|uniref:cDENN domain-containing protein n=1 Tax=Anaeramoeba flamelloides TaxID=1746091 RepID=A0ABQ8XQ42_9EUKA|nr:hypothetical protein M0813_29254 [Anaeramoeba flamelloides]
MSKVFKNQESLPSTNKTKKNSKKQKNHRQMPSIKQSHPKLFDDFVLLGPNVEQFNYKLAKDQQTTPQILTKYSTETSFDPRYLSLFCFSSGFVPVYYIGKKYLSKRKKKNKYKRKVRALRNEDFVFVLRGGEKPLYGYCVFFYSPIPLRGALFDAKKSSNHQFISRFCIVVLSRFVNYYLFNLIYSVLQLEWVNCNPTREKKITKDLEKNLLFLKLEIEKEEESGTGNMKENEHEHENQTNPKDTFDLKNNFGEETKKSKYRELQNGREVKKKNENKKKKKKKLNQSINENNLKTKQNTEIKNKNNYQEKKKGIDQKKEQENEKEKENENENEKKKEKKLKTNKREQEKETKIKNLKVKNKPNSQPFKFSNFLSNASFNLIKKVHNTKLQIFNNSTQRSGKNKNEDDDGDGDNKNTLNKNNYDNEKENENENENEKENEQEGVKFKKFFVHKKLRELIIPIKINCSSECENFEHARWGINTLLNFSITHLLLIVKCIVLGRSILFVSKSNRKLSKAVFAALSLISPLNYEGIVIPVLPREMRTAFIETPVPHLFGIKRTPQELSSNGEVLIVELDEYKIKHKEPNTGTSLFDFTLPKEKQLEEIINFLPNCFEQNKNKQNEKHKRQLPKSKSESILNQSNQRIRTPKVDLFPLFGLNVREKIAKIPTKNNLKKNQKMRERRNEKGGGKRGHGEVRRLESFKEKGLSNIYENPYTNKLLKKIKNKKNNLLKLKREKIQLNKKKKKHKKKITNNKSSNHNSNDNQIKNLQNTKRINSRKLIDIPFEFNRWYEISEKESKVSDQIINIFQTYFGSFFSDFQSYCISDITNSEIETTFSKFNFLNKFKIPEDKLFMKELMSTQEFNVFSDKRVKAIQKKLKFQKKEKQKSLKIQSNNNTSGDYINSQNQRKDLEKTSSSPISIPSSKPISIIINKLTLTPNDGFHQISSKRNIPLTTSSSLTSLTTFIPLETSSKSVPSFDTPSSLSSIESQLSKIGNGMGKQN